jgi:hypothetical protein
MSRWKVALFGLAVFGLGYLVCKVGDWLVYSDEERIADLVKEIVGRARARELDRLVDYLKLDPLGFQVRLYDEVHIFAAGEEAKVREKVRQYAQESSLGTLEVSVDEDDVRIDGEEAAAKSMLYVEHGGTRYKQPIRMQFRRNAGRWWLTKVELLRPDEILTL